MSVVFALIVGFVAGLIAFPLIAGWAVKGQPIEGKQPKVRPRYVITPKS